MSLTILVVSETLLRLVVQRTRGGELARSCLEGKCRWKGVAIDKTTTRRSLRVVVLMVVDECAVSRSSLRVLVISCRGGSGSGFEDLGGVRRSCICGWAPRLWRSLSWSVLEGLAVGDDARYVRHLPVSRLRPRWRMILVVVGATNLSADG